MFRKLLPLLVVGCWGTVVLPLPERATAATPLTRAVIQNIRNLVQLIPQNLPKRPARKSDAIIPGDGLSTGRASLAELRFNDGSLARVGEQAVFRFLPKTRNFRLTNGTVLLLIPPGQGRTRINTPNAAAAIRGSALFVRYDKKKETTVVAALTNSGIQVSNQDGSQSQELKAGQLLVVIKGEFQGLYNFDLRTFYDTSDIVRGLDLPRQEQPNQDPALSKVQSETAEAVKSQTPVNSQQVIENPSFTKLTPNPPDSSNNSNTNTNTNTDTDTNSLQQTEQSESNTEQQNNNTNTQPTNNNNSNPEINTQLTNTNNSENNSDQQNIPTNSTTNDQNKIDTPPPTPNSTTSNPNTIDKPKSDTSTPTEQTPTTQSPTPTEQPPTTQSPTPTEQTPTTQSPTPTEQTPTTQPPTPTEQTPENHSN